MGQLEQYLELLAHGAYAAEASAGLGAANLILLLFILARQKRSKGE